MSCKRLIAKILIAGAVLWYALCLPSDLFKGEKYSTVVNDRSGRLLGARTADDGQWRFSPTEKVPEKYKTALIEFEDRWFYFHPGVNPAAIARAAVQNIRSGHISSGGSTITMQVIRLSRGKDRTIREKVIESILATRLELRHRKRKILALYASHAPFGGNVVGLRAASWRYFGREPDELSWGEAATLAILPNSPSAMHPGRRRTELLEKRNRLLAKLRDRGKITSEEYELACQEPIPDAPQALPSHAPHLVEHYAKTRHGETVGTTIDLDLQSRVNQLTDSWSGELALQGINDLAAVVIDVHTSEVIAYVGNADPDRRRPGGQVDILRSPRSTGSILKPFLYCALLQDGKMLPRTLLPDIPVNISGFSPQNFDMQFAGAVSASEALARSLNVPAVHMLRMYGIPRFCRLLKDCGLGTINRSPDDYGLSLILGGAEGTLLDITRAYARMSESTVKAPEGFPLRDKTALWWTVDALKEVNRPDEIDWHMIGSVKKVAWKTGTSWGFRDAWAVGITPDYAVGVWAGNAGGKGVPGLTGARTAGPVMFEIFNLLPDKDWFPEPQYGDYITAEVCRESGHLAGPDCQDTENLMLPKTATASEPCPYHRMVDGESRFILPPAMEWFYRQHHPEYRPLSKAVPGTDYIPMEFIYPQAGTTIFIPRQLDGSIKGATFSLAHRNQNATVYWHLDESYLGETRYIHQMAVNAEPGPHTVTVVDSDGNSLSIGFTVGK